MTSNSGPRSFDLLRKLTNFLNEPENLEVISRRVWEWLIPPMPVLSMMGVVACIVVIRGSAEVEKGLEAENPFLLGNHSGGLYRDSGVPGYIWLSNLSTISETLIGDRADQP